MGQGSLSCLRGSDDALVPTHPPQVVSYPVGRVRDLLRVASLLNEESKNFYIAISLLIYKDVYIYNSYICIYLYFIHMYIYAYLICVCIYIFIFYIYICKGCMCVVPAWIDAKGFAQV